MIGRFIRAVKYGWYVPQTLAPYITYCSLCNCVITTDPSDYWRAYATGRTIICDACVRKSLHWEHLGPVPSGACPCGCLQQGAPEGPWDNSH